MTSTFIIAEAGVNHNGCKETAFKLIDVAVQAGADAVKFQTFKASNLVTKNAVKAEYQKKTTGADEYQLSMLKRLELDHGLHFELKTYAEKQGIEFMSTAFDSESLSFLVSQVNLQRLKIPSGEITNGPLLLEYARSEQNIILSTGMSSLSDIETALSVLAYGLIYPGQTPKGTEDFMQAYFSLEGQNALRSKVTLLHCTSEYPAPLDDINLAAISTMKSAFGLPVGYSDHTAGIAISTAAVALGATVIEKHYTLSREMEGPDHKASLEPDELKAMVNSIRDVEKAIGAAVKTCISSELKNRQLARKSLVAAQPIAKGEVITESHLTAKRPLGGISPMNYWDVLGSTAIKDYDEDDRI